MTSDLQNPRFGVNIHTAMQSEIDPVAEALQAEQLGFDLVTLHRDIINDASPSYEMWTLLTWLSAHTSRIKLAPLVLALPYRHPTVLAKMVETLDRLSGGRIILVLGAGGPMNEHSYQSFGLVQRNPQEKVAALEEEIDILRGLWNTSGFSYEGKHFHLDAAIIEPKPIHPIPIWLGVFGDRMVDLVGRKADGWIPSLPLLAPDLAYQKLESIRRSAENAGRNPDKIAYAYNIPVLVQAGAASRKGSIVGDAEQVAIQLANLVRHGFTYLNLWPLGDTVKQRELLVKEVIPNVYEKMSQISGP
jgi:alkanesulfonate monooxygenase SsuD/methylene tetrahydromethanopterin reductase-like flavin-dependent oxidoreductase (luciferase family)